MQEVGRWLDDLRAAGARIGTVSLAASTPMLQPGKSLEGQGSTIVRVGAALYGQAELVPGTVPAAQWFTRIASVRKVHNGKLLFHPLAATQAMHVWPLSMQFVEDVWLMGYSICILSRAGGARSAAA